jgi:hypothetical protein
MRSHILKTLIACASVLVVASCTTTKKPNRYLITIWHNLSEKQPFLTANGTAPKGGYLGHYLREPVSIGLTPIPEDSVIIGALAISSPTVQKCLPVKKWSDGGKTVYAIGDPKMGQAAVFIETNSKTLADPLLRELIGRFVPNK